MRKIILLLVWFYTLNSNAQTLHHPQYDSFEGEIIDGGVLCPLFQAVNGSVFTLTGVDKASYPPKTKISILGQFVRVSRCGEGVRTFNVKNIFKEELPK